MKNVLRIAALATALGLTGAAAAQQRLATVPAAPAWTLGQRFVTALNGYDRAALERFLAEVLSPAAVREQTVAERARALLQQRRQLGELEIVEVSGVPHAIVFNVRGKAGTARAETADIVVVMDSSDNGLADEIRLIPGHYEP